MRSLVVLLYLLVASASGSPLVSEIMFHPPGVLEKPEQEWIEIYNPDSEAIDIGNWKLTRGVTFTVPTGTTISPGGYLVIAADVATFKTAYPAFSGNVVGGWTGRLSNSGESIRLEDASGAKVNDVSYADEGDWALRARGPLSFGHKGWIWISDADGTGRTLELRNPKLGNGSGQNWGASTTVGGTPGAANSLSSTNVAPLIKDAKHSPEIPKSTNPIVISCDLEDESPGATAKLYWRVDGTTSFTAVPMTASDDRGHVEATIPPQANLKVVEWYIEATDGVNTRTWPAPARTSDIGALLETFAQTTNALLQVDDSFDPNHDFKVAGNQPIYRLIMTDEERAELRLIGTTLGQEESEATMNGTFTSHDGTGVKVRYRSGFRNRGQGSAFGPPNNYHVSFPSSDRWNGRAAFALNCRYGYSQALGQALAERAGLATQEAAVVRVRVNGVDLAETTARMYGRYVRLEGRGGDWAENHYPNDPDGNFYRLDDHDTGGTNPPGDLGSGEFRYEGTDPAAYSDTFLKETNKDANDYSDLANLARIVSAPQTGGTAEQPAISNAAYPAAVGTVLDLDNAYRFFAVDALLGNQEGGLQSGRADDASLYRGILDPRFHFVPHDFDDVFDIGVGVGDPITRSIFSYDGTPPGTGVVGLTRLFNHPQLAPRYYAAVLDALDTWFNRATIDPIIDQIMAGWVPATDGSPATPNRGIAEINAYVDARRAAVLAQIQRNYTLAVTGNASDTVEGYKVTTDGAATFSGTFNVARTYSITVNGQLAQWFYRTVGTDQAGTWRMSVPAGGGGILNSGLNRVVIRFWDAPNGVGNVLQEFTADVLFNAAGTGTTVNGTLTPPGSLTLTAPASYVPGVPVLVRVDLKDVSNAVNRNAWNSTITLTATNGVTLTPNTVTLFNGIGSALVSVGSGGGGSAPIFTYGSGGTGATGATSGTPGSIWKALTDLTTATIGNVPANWKDESFDDSSWTAIPTQTGYGDSDENRPFTRVDYNATTTGTQSAPSYLFRNTFTIADLSQISSVTGQVKYDDGCVVYINGTEILRTSNLDPAATLTSYANFNGAGTTENATSNLTIPLNLLHNGVNTIAVEVHQEANNSSDVTFDLRLQANLSASDPGDFTITATDGGLSTSKSLTSLGAATETTASGTLSAGATDWSGIVRVTSDVTVPAGATLNIAAGTHVLMTGTGTAGDTTGADIIVNGGTLAVNGTAAQPVSITCSDVNSRWGQIYLNGATPTVCNYLLMSRGGHSPGQGHTGRGPMWRLNAANLTLQDCAMGDGPAKALYSQGTCNLTLTRSILARMITGPEVEDGASVLIEDSNIQEILPHYRESNANVPDDEDCLYVHNSTGRPVVVRRSVFARCGDDVFDGLAGPLVVEDSILREGWDKGMSLLNNDLTITRTLIVNCDKAIVPKSNTATTRTVIADRCTIISENHNTTLAPWGYSVPPSSPDADTPSTGLYTQNKSGQSNTGATLSITATNCIILAESPLLVDAPYDPANTVVTYSITRSTDTPTAAAWPGTGNSNADPLFVSAATADYHLAAGSPAIDTGTPTIQDADGSRADMGALPANTAGGGSTGPAEVRWTRAGSPYKVLTNTTVPANLTLRIDPGVSVHFGKNVRLTVNGRLIAEGTPSQRIVFSHIPGTTDTGDSDPIKNGVQTGPPKWGGIRIYDSMAQESIVRYCDFINAQGTSTAAPENFGSLGFIRSWGWVDHCTFAGTHLRMCYGRNSKMTVTHNNFPDMFIFDPVLNRIENTTDFVASADNNQEPLKVEYPVTDPEVTGSANFANGQPVGGHFRVYFNDFHGNRGHNDVFDADSGRWNQPGQFVLDCRYNWFHGLSGDEHIDLGGDAYIASNIFEAATKDQWTSDTGYSNAISSGDKGTGTTIMVARNVFFDLDHAINCKLSTATIFEHNTVANFHADYIYTFFTPNQDVKCAPVNFFIPEDGTNPSYGDGAYMGFNLISNVPRLFSGADTRKVANVVVNDVTTKIEFNHNLLDSIGDQTIGPKHTGNIFTGTYGPNSAGAPGFVNPAAKDFTLRSESLARGTAPGGIDYGASVPEWAYVLDGPAGTTADINADFTVGGAGIVAYKWRLDGGAWSAPIQIGSGGVFPRGTTATVRQATLKFTALAAGKHTLEVLGQDMAGNWQDADPARTLEGLPQSSPTQRIWTVDPNATPVRLSEILADSATLSDRVELQNTTSAPVNLTGWSLSDDPLTPGKVPLTGTIDASAYVTFVSSALNLDKDGDTVYLFQGTTQRDAVTFGQQITDKSIGRVGTAGAWTLCTPTFDATNVAVPTGDFSSVRLSEWFASGNVLYGDDWIELSNTNATAVALAGLRVTDNRAGDSSAYTFPALSFIEGNGYLRLVADGSNTPGHLPFSLDAEYETISLLGAAGSPIDTVAFYPQTTDFSMGRNATGAYTFYELPTRGFANGSDNPAYANALLLLRHLRVTEIMFNAIGGSDFDYVELTNTGASALQLGGVRFVQGITFTFPTMTLNPGESVMVVKSLVKFRSRYGDAPVVAGTFSGLLDNGGETLGLQLPPPFDANVLTFGYNDIWYPLTDGEGRSLVVVAPGISRANTWGDRSTWQASVENGGNPAGATATNRTYSGWSAIYAIQSITTDDDHDGVAALVEFALGMDPQNGNGTHGSAGAPAGGSDGAGHVTLTFLVPANSGAVQGHGFSDTIYRIVGSDDLVNWTPIATKTYASAWNGTGSVTVGNVTAGYVPVTVIDLSAPTGGKRFLRLEVTWQP